MVILGRIFEYLSTLNPNIMKKVLAIACLLSLFSTTQSMSQNIAPESLPASVKSKFNEKFPGAVMPIWKQEAPGFVDVNFTLDKKKYHATFAGHGDWVSTTQYFKVEELPATISTYVSTEFPKGKIISSGLTETKTEKTYEVSVRNSGVLTELVFDLEGKLKFKEQIE
jgi:hypothetical protein